MARSTITARVVWPWLAVTAMLAPPAIAAARLLPAPDGRTAWMLLEDGTLARLDLESGVASAWPDPGPAPLFTDIDLSPDGRTVYGLTPSGPGGPSRLVALSASSGSEERRWDLRGNGRLLAVSPDGRRAGVAGWRAASSRREPDDQVWMLSVVDLDSGSVGAPVALGLEPRDMAFVPDAGGTPRLFMAAKDRVATWTIDPPRPSWFYKSPGDNTAVTAGGTGPVIALLRDGALAIIDPKARTREEGGRVRLSEDDATAVVPLPARGRAVALTPDTSVAAALLEDGTSVVFVGTGSAGVIETRTLSRPRRMMGRLAAGEPPRLVLATGTVAEPGAPDGGETIETPAAPPAAAPAGVSAGAARDEPPAGDPGLDRVPPAPEQAPDTGPEPEPAPEKEPEPAPAPEAPPAPEPAPETGPEPEPAPEKEPEPAPGTKSPSGPGTDPAPDAAAAPEPRPAPRETLTGRITGETAAAREVLVFGPDNLIRLHARTPIAGDGTFTIPLPPPGSYRVIVSAGPDRYLFTSPPYRTIVVKQPAEGMTGLEGIDFEVRGKL